MNVKGLTSATGLLCTVALGASLIFQQANLNKIDRINALNSGVGTCFQRVSQSFTSLMTKDLTSNHLSKIFLTTTGECLTEGSEIIADNKKTFDQRSAQLLNQFSSDYFWFSQKALKLKNLNEREQLDLRESNIVNKFSTIDDLRAEFSSNSDSLVKNYRTQNTKLTLVAAASFFFMVFSLVGFFFYERRRSKVLSRLDKEAADLVKNTFDRLKAQRIFTNTFHKLGMKSTIELFNQYEEGQTQLESISEAVPMQSQVLAEKEVETVSLGDSLNNNLEQFNQKILSLGVKLDMNMSKDFHVNASQDLIDQIIFHALNYSLSFSKNRTLKIKSSLLGGTAILGFHISEHCFNSSELDYLNNNSTEDKGINLDLKLLREITADLEGSFSLKNRIDTSKNQTNSELEFIFRVANVRKKNVNVVKGTKKEILARMLNSEI